MSYKKEQISPTTKIKVYINCGGKCGFPECKEHLVEENSIIGQIAHIKAQQPGGPRFDITLTKDKIDAPENLIAFCQKHHKIIDDHPDKYSVEDISNWKKDIEEWAKKSPEKTELGKKLILIILSDLEKELDRGNGEYVLKTIQSLKIITETIIKDDIIGSEIGILEAKSKQALEDVEGAIKIYESLSKLYPKNVKPILYLAEIYLNKCDYEKNKELLEQAEKIDNSHWLFVIEQLIREFRLNKKIDTSKINEKDFPEDKKQKATYYRIYSLFYQNEKNDIKADEFIEKSIKLYPYSFSAFNLKISHNLQRLIEKGFPLNHIEKAEDILSQIKEIEKEKNNWDRLHIRGRATLEFRKFYIYIIQQDGNKIISTGKGLIDLILKCSFDLDIDNFLSFLLANYRPEEKDFEKIISYLSNKKISYDLAKILAFQFCEKGKLLTDGKNFLSAKNEKIKNLILNIEENKESDVINFLKEDLQLMITFANCLKTNSGLRKKIIDSVPDDENIQKDRIYLLYYSDIKAYDDAFRIIQNIDFENASYLDCKISLKAVREKQAWEMEAKILERLFQLEKDERIKLSFKLDHFTACMKMEDYLEVINIGKYLLDNPKTFELMDKKNQELLLGQTITAYLQRSEEKEALGMLQKYPNIIESFEFIISVEAEVYLKNGDYKKALSSLCRGVKKIGKPTKEQYGYLFLSFTQLSNSGFAKIEPLEKVVSNSFIKFQNQEQWYYIGDGDELDATKIISANNKYNLLINKKINDNIDFPEDKYQTNKEQRIVENILSLEAYINWKSHDSFFSLSKQGRWDAGIAIEVPNKDDSIDVNNVINFIKDQQERGRNFFDDYCSNNYPFAFLALSEGGVTNAIGRITNENKGFIRFSDGSIQDIDRQRKVAEKILNGSDIFLDGTTALFLAETGLLKKIVPFIPNLKVPQSVISFLFKVLEKFNISPGQVGHMRCANDQLVFDKVDIEKNNKIKENFKQSIEILEKDKKSIFSISQANKSEHFSESNIVPELVDACILAQKNDGIVLTEDFLYLQANNLQTNKGIPEYCSLFSLIKELLKKDKISFEDYLNAFYYLSSYRCRFLDLNTGILIRAIFGEDNKLIFEFKNIRKLNLALTLSEEYGVKTEAAIQVMGGFLVRIIIANIVSVENANKVYREVLPTFFLNRDKKIIGRLLFEYCSNSLEKILKEKYIYSLPILMSEKLAALEKQINAQLL
ncbi:MAG: hypothetical protein WC582_00260 [Patescibacteria group bacterium]